MGWGGGGDEKGEKEQIQGKAKDGKLTRRIRRKGDRVPSPCGEDPGAGSRRNECVENCECHGQNSSLTRESGPRSPYSA